MDKPLKLVETHPRGITAETHYLTVERLNRHSNHLYVRVISDCGLEMEACLHGTLRTKQGPPTCEACATRGLIPRVLSDVLGALAAGGDL